MLHKKVRGQYYTTNNPFSHPAFAVWANEARLKDRTILEPFAGSNSLIHHLQSIDLCKSFRSFDIEPANSSVEYRDTLVDFPTGYDVCVTNPPWLARNIATYKKIHFPKSIYSNLYQIAIENCLRYCNWTAALVPESFIRANIFRERLVSFVSITRCLFVDTGHPVGMALFAPVKVPDTEIWTGNQRVGMLSELEATYPVPDPKGPAVSFNEPDGNVGLIALDNTVGASIRFCPVEELSDYEVKPTGRHITKLQVDGSIRICAWNDFLNKFRKNTQDVLMTCYKGIRKDGHYRRRLDWQLARGIIHNA